VLASALWLVVPATDAAELGKLTVRSRLGQPLNAEIEILALKPGEEKTLVARLASRAAFIRAGVDYNAALAGVRANIARRAGRPVLSLRSNRSINEPFLEVLLELQSNAGRQARAYTLLLDPTGYKPPAATAVPAKPPPGPTATPAAPPPAAPQPAEPPAPAPSREALFGELGAGSAPPQPDSQPIVWRGFVQNYSAYDYKDPAHWSRAVIRTQLGAQGASGNLKWKASARIDVDPVYAGSDFYPPEVRKDQKRDFFLRETYIDTSAGGLDFRLGKQNIVWGEMVGLFFADVVSARDQRDFILPDFEILRIPQWAVRAERLGENYHAEVIWLPYPEVDIIGRPGAEFFPFQVPPPAGFAQQFNNQVRPTHTTRNSNLGLRGSILRRGWDLSAFYYRSTDVNPTFYREVMLAPTPTLIFTPRHDRIWQVGSTLGKDLGATVAKAEVIYASGRKFNVTRPTEPTGVVSQNTLDYVVGFDFTLPRDTRLNLQYFERVFIDHDPDLLQDRREGGVTLLLSGKLGASVEPELLLIQSVNRSDRLVRAKLGWIPQRNWRLTFGVDVFSGPVTGLFGRFDDNDRVYLETRYDF
jgi:hypothetical protein